MIRLKLPRLPRNFLMLFFAFLMAGCIDPVAPEFDYKEGLVFIEGFASTAPGASFVIVSSSTLEFGIYGIKFLAGATVSFVNVDTGATVSLTEAGESYLPPHDFVVAPGELWKLNVTLANGKNYESSPEKVLQPIPIKDIQARYDPELVYRQTSGGKFVPGHAITVSFDDPVDTDNYYYWSFRSFESLYYCEKCRDGIFRNGACTPYDLGGRGNRYFDYSCDVDCWKIRFPESISIFNDQFSNGKTITDLPVGDVLLYTKENVVVEVQQFSLTSAAFDYYKILKDIVDNSGGLNAPPPAALIGNLTNPDDANEFVFGRFTAAATSVASIFIDRSGVAASPLESREPIVLEPQLNSPYPPPPTITAPCLETKFRTAIRPVGWVN